MTLAAVFPGQGSQYVGMGNDLVANYPETNKILDIADRICDYPLSEIISSGPKPLLDETINAQPAIYTINYIIWSLINGEKIRPKYLAGHSLGEISACLAAEVFSFESGLKIVIERAKLMAEAAARSGGGMMAVIGLDDLRVIEVAEAVGLQAVNFNCPGQVVVAGTKRNLEESKSVFAKAGAKKVVNLAVSGAFHSNAMTEASEKFAIFLEDINFSEAVIPVISNETARPLVAAGDLKIALARQLTSPVHWRECVESMIAGGVDKFVEVGPGRVLSGLIKRISSEVVVERGLDGLCA